MGRNTDILGKRRRDSSRLLVKNFEEKQSLARSIARLRKPHQNHFFHLNMPNGRITLIAITVNAIA
jgi:hypothetical protein